jgi:hypothetical protein
MARIADSFAVLEPLLRWMPRPTSGPFASDNWLDGRANAAIVGPGGLEYRENLIVGVSLLAPHVRYPDHNHSHEEVYLVLSPGVSSTTIPVGLSRASEARSTSAPNIKHALESNGAPLLAIWCLWNGAPISL